MCEKPSNCYLDFCTRITDNVAFTIVKPVEPELVIFQSCISDNFESKLLACLQTESTLQTIKNRKLLMHV